jgi:hypothetical protein
MESPAEFFSASLYFLAPPVPLWDDGKHRPTRGRFDKDFDTPMTASEHFAAEHWADFVRNVAPDDQARLMEQHLADGCQSCRTAHADWRSVGEVAASDRAYDVPDASTRLAKAMFSIQRAPGFIARAMEAVTVLFDSELAPAAAGVRSTAAGGGRKVLYHMGDFLVDVQIESTRDGQRTTVMGQIVVADDAVADVRGVPIVLLRDLSVIGKGLTNSSGEFHVEFAGPSENLSVALGLREEGTVVSLGSSSARHS